MLTILVTWQSIACSVPCRSVSAAQEASCSRDQRDQIVAVPSVSDRRSSKDHESVESHYRRQPKLLPRRRVTSSTGSVRRAISECNSERRPKTPGEPGERSCGAQGACVGTGGAPGVARHLGVEAIGSWTGQSGEMDKDNASQSVHSGAGSGVGRGKRNILFRPEMLFSRHIPVQTK